MCNINGVFWKDSQFSLVRNNKSIQILQNYWANFNQTWQKASFGKSDTSLFKMKGHAFSKVG